MFNLDGAERLMLIERLAELAHDQWAGWTEYMLNELSPANTERWRRQIGTPYSMLSPAEQDSDRVEARKVLYVIERFFEVNNL